MSNENEAKLKALKLTLDKLDKTYGKGTVMKMGDSVIEDVEVIPSGSLGLDLALGVGGYPRGRVIEIYGPESSGKTTLTLHAIAEAQKNGGIAAFIDAEHAFDRFYAQKLGVDIDNLIISQPDNGEQALEIADNLIRSGAIDIVIVDSVAALTPKSEIEGENRKMNCECMHIKAKAIECIRLVLFFFFSSRRRHTILVSDWSSDVCSSDL